MFKTKNGINSDIFNGKFQNVKHIYPTSFSKNNYFLPQTQKTFLKSEILSCSSSLWSNILPASTKSINSLPLISHHLFFFNAFTYFYLWEPLLICQHLLLSVKTYFHLCALRESLLISDHLWRSFSTFFCKFSIVFP